MNPIIFLSVYGLLVCSAYGRAIDEPDNSISNNVQYTRNTDWVKITSEPPTTVLLEPDSKVELKCEVIGSPPPSVHWVRGNTPIDRIDFESNLISENSPNARAIVISRLIIDYASAVEGSFTCVGRAGSKMTQKTTTVFRSSDNNNMSVVKSKNELIKARIVTYFSTIFDTIGQNVVLPCRAAGRPDPEIYWLDITQNVINAQSPRYKVLTNGDLLIPQLRWSDMGTYTCIAKNAVSKDLAETFVYPMIGQ